MRKLKNQIGSFIIWLMLAFALLGTFVGFVLDFGRAYLEKARVSRLVDAAALAAAKVLKGQPGLENDATRAACDSMSMNGVSVQMSGNSCVSTQGALIQASVEFFDLPAPGGPPVRAVRVTGTEPVSTTFLRFLGWMVPGDYSSINVLARAEAGPERPVDLMLILDRSGSMSSQDGSGQTKINALKIAVNAFLGLQNTFSANDRIGMISFSSRGCGVNGADTTWISPRVLSSPLFRTRSTGSTQTAERTPWKRCEPPGCRSPAHLAIARAPRRAKLSCW
jgi:hypothetical protein